jgi:hypothetical protein
VKSVEIIWDPAVSNATVLDPQLVYFIQPPDATNLGDIILSVVGENLIATYEQFDEINVLTYCSFKERIDPASPYSCLPCQTKDSTDTDVLISLTPSSATCVPCSTKAF